MTIWMKAACVSLIALASACSQQQDNAARTEQADHAALIPERTAAMVDASGRLPVAEVDKLSQRLAAFRRVEGPDIAVLVVETTGQVPMADYARQVATTWNLGRPNIADGILITYAIADGAVQIEIGCGLETSIDNATVASLISDRIVPAFTRRDTMGGLNAAVDALMPMAADAPLPPAGAPAPDGPIWAGQPVSEGCQL